jgi:adenosylmethionine-8-amino-7-oxononanoate aminotransferase
MTPDALRALDRAHLWHPFTQQSAWVTGDIPVIERADGHWLVDVDGRRYLDGVSSLWTNVLGHRHPDLDAALVDQLGRVAHTTLLGLSHPPAIELAATLARLAPAGLQRVFFSDNGSTAAEIALKMAFQYHRQTGAPERTRFAGLVDGYHGDTIGAVSVGGISLFHGLFRPLLFDAIALPSPVWPGGDEEDAAREAALVMLDAHGPTLAALVVEPLVQGAAGMKMHTADGYLRPIVERARAHGVLVIADEVAVGVGRLGPMFACEAAGITPDLLCVAKGLGGGYLPIAATLANERIYEAFLGAPHEARQFFHGHTFTGNPLACAVALATLRALEGGALSRGVDVARHLERRLPDVRALPQVSGVRQRGVMVGVDLVRPDGAPFEPSVRAGARVTIAARDHALIVRPLGDTLVLNPPLTLSSAEVDHLVDATIRAIEQAIPR